MLKVTILETREIPKIKTTKEVIYKIGDRVGRIVLPNSTLKDLEKTKEEIRLKYISEYSIIATLDNKEIYKGEINENN